MVVRSNDEGKGKDDVWSLEVACKLGKRRGLGNEMGG